METERGLIQCLHCEIKRYCHCLATHKQAAQGMEKVERYRRCHQEFPKPRMENCDWPYYRSFCTTIRSFCTTIQDEAATNDVVPRKTNDRTKKKKTTTAATTGMATANVKDDDHEDSDDGGGRKGN